MTPFGNNKKPRRECKQCGEMKMRSHFNSDLRAKDKKSSICKVCSYSNTQNRKRKHHPDREDMWNINEDAIYCL